MKRVKNIYKAACLLGLVAVSTTSCTDWLTIYPQDKVVEEQFWEDKTDLEGVRYGAYKQMANTIEKLAIWGDLRSDSYNINTSEHGDQGHRDTYDQIIKAMPDSSMSQFDWGSVYTTINYCNKVLQHGEEVLAKDRQFTSTEWIQMRAEMTALRALNYFYLLRAFKDIPYSEKVINTDAEVLKFGLTNQMIVLDSCITQCERVAGQARNRFVSLKDSKGMITNTAIYAMLADMYLWRGSLREGRVDKKTDQGDSIVANGVVTKHTIDGDYKLAAEYADKSLAALALQNREEQNSGFDKTIIETINFGLTNCDMIKNDFDGVYQSTTPQLEAMTEIFYKGNSVESIFELQYSQSDGRKNDMVNSLYGYSNGTHLMVSQEALSKVYGSWGDDAKYDSRTWYSCQNLINTGSSSSSSPLPGYYNIKYMYPTVTMDGQNTSRQIKYMRTTSSAYNHWIIYRMTDVMLMKAEALLCISASDKEAKRIVDAIHRRSYCNYNKPEPITTNIDGTTTADKVGNAIWAGDLKTEKGTIKGNMVTLLRERQIELLGEGKRWFDLVRLAERLSYNVNDKGDPRECNDDPESTKTANQIRKTFGLPDLAEGAKIPNGLFGVSTICEAFMKNAYGEYWPTLRNRMKNRYGLYCPIYYMEVKSSDGAIEQNPVWNKSKYAQTTD